jgi:trehalose synthase
MLSNYTDIAGEEAIEEIRRTGERLSGKKIGHINSTKIGGGVAEILQRLIPLLRDVGVDAEWKTIEGELMLKSHKRCLNLTFRQTRKMLIN